MTTKQLVAQTSGRHLLTSKQTFGARYLAPLRPLYMAAISIGLAGVLWHLSVGTLFSPQLVATPGDTVAMAWDMLKSGELLRHVGVSLSRVLVGFIAGCVLGVVFGALIGRFRLVRELTDPIIELTRPISPIALLPLAMLWFGIGEFTKYFLITYATVVVVLINTVAGVSRTPPTRIRAARCLGANDLQLFLKVILPSAVPFILTGMRVALGFSFMAVVAAELVGAREGIGFLIMNSRMLLQTDQLFVGLFSLGVVGAIIDRVFRILLDRSMRRYMQYHREV